MNNTIYPLYNYAESVPKLFGFLEWIAYWKINKNPRIQWSLSTQKSEVIVV